MGEKRSITSLSLSNSKRRKSGEHMTYFQRMLQECGLILKKPQEKCDAIRDIVYIVRDLKKSLQEDDDYPHNIDTFFTDFTNACNDKNTFEHYLFLNVVRKINDKSYNVDNSVIKILLNVTFLQTKLVNYIFDKLMDVLDQPDFGPWVKMTLKSFSNLDTLESSEELSKKLIDLLDVSTDKFVRLEIISAIPDIIGDCEHDNVASELSRILAHERYLIPSILDCLTNLCLSDTQFQRLQRETLILMQPSYVEHFSNFVKFLLTPGRLTDDEYEKTIHGLRKELAWSSVICPEEVIATSQILTEREIRNSMLSSKAVAKAWLKVTSSCQTHQDHKPIDIIFFLIIASLSDEKQKSVEKQMRDEIKLQILQKELLNEAFKTFKPILKKHIMTLISLANSLLKSEASPLVEAFGAHMHMVMFSELSECRALIVSELLRLVINCKKSALNTLNILNNITSDNLSIMKAQSNQMLMLLDRLEDMSIPEIAAIMNLVCKLAYSFADSNIRDELHIIIRKELGSSIPSIKKQGVLAGVHAVKYLVKNTDKVEIPENVTLNMTSCFPEGDLLEAALIIELIHDSTAPFPDMVAFFYDQLFEVINNDKVINESFLEWLTSALTNYWQENFLVDNIEKDSIDDIKLSMQFRLNDPSEIDELWGINIAGLALEDNKEVNIDILSSLFQLVRMLHYKKEKGSLSDIDALLGCPIVMPIVDVDEINDLNEASVQKILKCYILCVNWIRELLNAFVTQNDDVLKPKILSRITQLRDLENTVEKIKDKGRKSDNDASVAGNPKTQQTQVSQITKTKLAASNNLKYRPLDLTLLYVLQYDLSPTDTDDSVMTFDILIYILSYINVNLEKVLVPQIKKKTYLTKDKNVESYNYNYATKIAQSVHTVLPKIMQHVNLIVSFLDGHDVEAESVDFETLEVSNIMESLLCLEYLYDFLTIYLRWIEFKNNNVPFLKSSLQIIAKIEDDSVLLEELLTTVAKAFQKHEKYMITTSSAASLMQLMKALQDLSGGPEMRKMSKDMAFKFLSKQWKTTEDPLQKGLNYSQYIETWTKVYLDNNNIADLKDLITSLAEEAENLRDKTTCLQTLKSINKSNFHILFRNLGAALSVKIQSQLKGGFTNEELIQMLGTVAYIHKLMSKIVTTMENKNTASNFLRQSIPILHNLVSKGFPILKIAFQENRDAILDMLKDFQASTECLQTICAQCKDTVLMQKIPTMEELLTNFIYKTEDLLKTNDCSEALKTFDVRQVPSRDRTKRAAQRPVNADETIEDSDEDFPEDETNIIDYGASVGLSELI